MSNERKLITTINGTEIYAITDNGEVYVPVKPICEALGIDVDSQRNKIKEDILIGSTTAIITVVAADGKSREMLCLPLKYTYGWLATINPGKVNQDSRERVIEYRKRCYEVLYDYFAGNMKKTLEANNAEIELLKEINSALSEEKEAKARRKNAEEKLNKLRAERLNPQPTLF